MGWAGIWAFFSQTHLATLIQGDVFRCTVDPKCNYSTPKRLHFDNHMRAHKGEKAFKW
jgi:hypothetical protein